MDAGLPKAPAGQVATPCALPLATAAAEALNAHADTMREYLVSGEQEQKRLAQALGHAATAYEQADQEGKDALDNGKPMPAPTMPAAVTLPKITPQVHSPKTGFVDEYGGGVEQAARDIAAPDQGASLNNFDGAWRAHANALSEHADALQPCAHWEGDAAEGAKTTVAKHKEWLWAMSQCAANLSAQAEDVVAAHREAAADHPTVEEVARLKKAYIWAAQNGDEQTAMQAMQGLEKLQRKSEHVLSRYASKAHVSRISPELPPGTPDPQPVPYRSKERGGVQAIDHHTFKQGPPPPPPYPTNEVIAEATDLDGNHVILRRGYYDAATQQGFGWDKAYWRHGVVNPNVFKDLISHSRPVHQANGTLIYDVPINRVHCTRGPLGTANCQDTGESLTMRIVVDPREGRPDVPDGGQKGVITMYPIEGGSGVIELGPNWTWTPPWVNNNVPIN
jgi:hypothetical protein